MGYLSCPNCHGGRPARTLSGYLTGGTVATGPIWPPMSATGTMRRNRYKPFAAYPFPHPMTAGARLRTRALGHWFQNQADAPHRFHPLGADPDAVPASTNYPILGGLLGALGILVGSAPLMAAGTLIGSFTIAAPDDVATIPQTAATVSLLPGITTSTARR